MTTIAARATAQGRGAIGIVRLSGPDAHALLGQVFVSCSASFRDFRPWVLHRGRFVGEDGDYLDDVLAVYMPAPKTYTGEDMAEIHCHGGPLILDAIVRRLFALGAESAEGGEFTKRAFLNGRMDLSQAEAVSDLINAASKEALKADVRRLDGAISRVIEDVRAQVDTLRAHLASAVDFPDDEVECLERGEFQTNLESLSLALSNLLRGQKRQRIMQEGASVVLAGAVNAGKSSLMNALLGRERALVTPLPGTTRDYLEEFCDLDGVPVRLTDTAGLRTIATTDPIETLGIERGKKKCSDADCLILLLDGTTWTEEDLKAEKCPRSDYASLLAFEETPKMLVWNKVDAALPSVFPPVWAKDMPFLTLSASTGEGLDGFVDSLRRLLLGSGEGADCVSCTSRQAATLEKALGELKALKEDVAKGIAYDVLAVRLDYLAELLGEVIGLSTSQDVLNDIFGRFCIGK